ncbi:MAG: Flp pilus assembly protein CpaB [Burkholderiales bacterium]
MKFKVTQNGGLLLAAVLLGLLAAWLMNRAVQQRMDQLDEIARRGQEMVDVVVANRDLDKGDILASGVLAVRQIPRQYAHTAAVSPANFAQIENARLQVPIRRGEALLPAHLDGLGSRVFSNHLQKGMRALTLEVDEVSSTAGMLRPGDHIDLIYSVKQSGSVSEPDERILFPLLSNVTVLATGQEITKQDARGGERRYANVTLEVTPEDANRILLAKATGDLTAVLRSPDDNNQNQTSMLTPDALIPGYIKKQAKTEAPTYSRPSQGIEFLIGGSAGGGERGGMPRA